MHDLWRLIPLLRPYMTWIVAAIGLNVIVLLANIFLMGLAGWFIAAMAIAGVAGVSMNYFTPAAMIRALAIVRTGGRYGERLISHEATLHIIARLRTWCFQRLEPLIPADLQGWHSGELLDALRQDMKVIESAYLRVFLPCISGLITGIIVLLFIAWFDATMAMVVGGLLLLAGILLPLLCGWLGQSSAQQKLRRNTQLTQHNIDFVQGLAELKVYAAETRHQQRLLDISTNLGKAQQHLHQLQTFAEEAIGFSANLAMWSVILLAIPLLTTGALAPENVILLVLLAFASFEIVLPLPVAMTTLAEVKSATKHLFSLTEKNPTIRSSQTPVACPASTEFIFDHVSFQYPGRTAPVLSEVSFSIHPGERILIAGPSGIGKSTIIHLLLRFWEPTAGQIRLQNQPLAAFDIESLRSQFSVAAQQPHLFADSIEANCRLAKPTATLTEIEDACRLAQLHDFILAQPAGYQTPVGEHGLKLSGGQKRRLGIAQALLRAAPILILDEPDEGLDEQTQQKLLTAVMHSNTHETILLISHQATSVDYVDRVIQL